MRNTEVNKSKFKIYPTLSASTSKSWVVKLSPENLMNKDQLSKKPTWHKPYDEPLVSENKIFQVSAFGCEVALKKGEVDVWIPVL